MIKNRNPLISVLIPCYKSAGFIHRAIESVIAQTYKNWELICVDDCSTDNTLEILQKYATQDKRIHVYKTERNQGRAAPVMNIAVDKARGEYVFVLGHDDAYSPDCIEKNVARANETGADVILPDAVFLWPDSPSRNWYMAGITKKFGKTNQVIDRSVVLTGRQAVELSLNWSIHAWGMFRTSIVKKYKYNPNGMNGDEFSAREFFLHANKIVFSDGKYFYYQNPESITKKISPKIFDVWQSGVQLEKLLIQNNFPKLVIRKYNRARFSQYCYLSDIYEKNKVEMSTDISRESAAGLQQFRDTLRVYKTFRDYLFRKEKWGGLRILVFLNFIKISYNKRKR